MKLENQIFKENESYKHKLAKEVLKDWLKDDYLRIDIESKFSMNGFLKFIPDLSCYNENGLIDIFEVVHTNPISVYKLWKLELYFHVHNWNVNVYEISADWILNQITKPSILKTQKRL